MQGLLHISHFNPLSLSVFVTPRPTRTTLSPSLFRSAEVLFSSYVVNSMYKQNKMDCLWRVRLETLVLR